MDLHRPCASLTSFQKGVHYECVKLFNSLPIEIKSLTNDVKSFTTSLRNYLCREAFYSVDEFVSGV